MVKVLPKLYFLFYLLLLGLPCFGQEPVFRNIGIGQGMPSSEVYRVIQDKKGIIWMSTDAGLCKFNGYSIKCFSTEQGLPDNTLFDLLEDSKGRIWINCYNGALGYFEGDNYTRVKASAELESKLSSTHGLMVSLAFDEDENLRIGTSINSYYLLKKENYAKLYLDNSFNDSANCLVHVLSNGGIISSANRTKLNYLISKSNKSSIKMQIKRNKALGKILTLFPNELFNPKICVLQNAKKEVLFSSRNYLVIDSAGNQKIHHFPKTIISLFEDQQKNIWVGLVNGGVYVYKNGDFQSKPQHFLSNYSVSSILIDRENGLWLSTFEKGVFYAPSIEMRMFPEHSELNTSIAGLYTFGSKVYLATTSNSLFSIDKNFEVKELSSQKDANQSNMINFFSYDNKLVMGGSRVTVFDTVSGKFQYPHNKSSNGFFGTSISINERNNLVFVAQGGFYEINNNEVIQKATLPSRATSIYRINPSNWLLGTLKGLFLFDGKSYSKINHELLAKERINFITQDQHGRIYIATKNKGLFIQENNKWTNLTKAEGLSSDICNSIFCDLNDTVWVSTNNGVSYFKASDYTSIKVLNSSHGIASNEVTAIARLGNELFIANKEGLNCLNLKSHFSNVTPPLVEISSVREAKSAEILINNSLLNATQNNLLFTISCPTFKNLFKPVYRYQLIGFADSSYFTQKEFLEFQNLEPGNYQLKVSAINNDGVHSKNEAVFSFQIVPPFYKKNSFILLEIILAILIIYLLTRWRINVIRRKDQLKSEMLASITESRMTALQAQMNPHFIFNAINSIQSLILNKDTQNAYDYLAKFARLVRLVLNNSKRNQIRLQTEIETLELYVQMEQLRFKNNFEFIIHAEELSEQLNEIEIPVMLIQPFVENSIWHGIMPLNELRKGKIELQLSLKKPYLIISIIDNGIGRNQPAKDQPEKKHKSLGIQLVEERISLINSSSKEKAHLEINDLTDEKGNPSGTQVTILLPYEND